MTVSASNGRVALVTGGAKGIGAQVGQALAAKGFKVWVADKDVQSAQAWAAALQGGRLVGECLGELTERVLQTVEVRRLLLSGGDTSSAIMQRLAPQALQVHARLAPGAPLCKLLSDKPHLRQLEVALKGGQMGSADFFVQALRGREA